MSAVYVDTSCLLKLVWLEPESARVRGILAAEGVAVVSDLAWLELTVRIKGKRAGGEITRARERRILEHAINLFQTPPFETRHAAPTLLEDARSQAGASAAVYCRTLDRLHLAALTGMGLRRLLTNDDVQAQAARAMGIEVLLPR